MRKHSLVNVTRLVPRMRLSSTEEERTRSAECHPVEYTHSVSCGIEFKSAEYRHN